MINNLDPAGTAQARAEIANYKKVMTEDFDVPEDKFFGTLAISRSELDLFFGANPGATSVRIYLSKQTPDPLLKDYGLSFVPCMELTDSNGTYYQDRLEIAPGEPGKIIMAACRIPPGCTFGGELNPNP
jgi:hypothetical protein